MQKIKVNIMRPSNVMLQYYVTGDCWFVDVRADEFCGAEVENRVLKTQRSILQFTFTLKIYHI